MCRSVLHTLVRVGRTSRMEHTLQDGVVYPKEVFHHLAVGHDDLHIAVDRLLVDW